MAKCGSKAKMGAPEFEYSEALADEICFSIATSKDGLEAILNSNSTFPKARTVYKWLFNKPEFAQKYREAKEHQQDILVDSQKQELEWARNYTYLDAQGNNRIDSGAVALAKLACDNIKWDASKKAPKKYGVKDNKEPPVNPHEQSISSLPNE
jgi:hypothetical protein